MNAKTIALVILFLNFALPVGLWPRGSFAKAEIPGVIVYSNGKDAIEYNFKTRENKNLTSDLPEAVVKDPFAVSEDGTKLVWKQGSMFWVRDLPMGTPRTIKVNRKVYKQITKTKSTSNSKDDIVEDIVWQGGEINNVSLSPDGARLAFDTIFKEPSWVFKGTMYYNAGNSTLAPSGIYPIYARVLDSYNGIYYLSTIQNVAELNRARPLYSYPRYGNVLRTPPVTWFKDQEKEKQDPNHYGVSPGGELDTGPMICYKTAIKTNAHYLAFQNIKNWEAGNKFGAFIYEINGQWGPIELRVFDSKIQEGRGDEIRQGTCSYMDPEENLQKPREWEILVSCKTCEGLFWKPDGSLTILSGGDLYSIDHEKIQEGINKSDVVKSRKGNMISFSPINNIFQAEPQIVAQGINSTCLAWVSDDAFLFLGKDMIVYLWDNGRIENLLYTPISSKFYYCSKSPFIANVTTADEVGSVPLVIDYDKNTTTETEKWETTTTPISEKFEIGGIKFKWNRVNKAKTPFSLQSETIRVKKTDDIGYFFGKETEGKNPSQYSFNKVQKSLTTLGAKWLVDDDSIVIFKINDKYIVIKPLKNVDNSVIYQWQLLPEEIPAKEILKTAQQ